MRGFQAALMSGGTPDFHTNKPTTILALRVRADFWPSSNSAPFDDPASIPLFWGSPLPKFKVADCPSFLSGLRHTAFG